MFKNKKIEQYFTEIYLTLNTYVDNITLPI